MHPLYISSTGEAIQLKLTKCESNIRNLRLLKTADNQLYASGSGQFSAAHLPLLKKEIDKLNEQALPILIVNLREESTGFINGEPIVWKNSENNLNKGMSVEEIEKEEDARLMAIKGQTVQAVKGKTSQLKNVSLTVQTVQTEKSLMQEQGFHYLRLPVTDHHAPLDKEVEEFIHLLQENRGQWIHIHCYVGKARTTTFLTMYQIFYEATQLTLDEILQKQQALGGSDLQKIKLESKYSEEAQKRLAFLDKFYHYCKEKPTQSWTEWVKKAEFL